MRSNSAFSNRLSSAMMIPLVLLPSVLFLLRSNSCTNAFTVSPVAVNVNSVLGGVVRTGRISMPLPLTSTSTFSRSSTSESFFRSTDYWSLASARDAYFQLEEREDADICITELFLKADGTVLVLQSDGPRCTSAGGSWTQHLEPSEIEFGRSHTKGQFRMTLTRSYPAGYPKSKDTDMGNFGYDVVRSYVGEFQPVGNKLGVNGKILMNDPSSTVDGEEVGFFEMIDTTEEKMKTFAPAAEPVPTRPQQPKIRLVPMGL